MSRSPQETDLVLGQTEKTTDLEQLTMGSGFLWYLMLFALMISQSSYSAEVAVEVNTFFVGACRRKQRLFPSCCNELHRIPASGAMVPLLNSWALSGKRLA